MKMDDLKIPFQPKPFHNSMKKTFPPCPSPMVQPPDFTQGCASEESAVNWLNL